VADWLEREFLCVCAAVVSHCEVDISVTWCVSGWRESSFLCADFPECQ